LITEVLQKLGDGGDPTDTHKNLSLPTSAVVSIW